jgi:hypothetical protein
VIAAPPPAVVSQAKHVVRDEQRARTIGMLLSSSNRNWVTAARDTYALARDRGEDTDGFLRWLQAATRSTELPNGISITTGFRLHHAGRALSEGYQGTQEDLAKIGRLIDLDTPREEIDEALATDSLDDLYYRKTGKGAHRVQILTRTRELEKQVLAAVKGFREDLKPPVVRALIYDFAASHPQEFAEFVGEHAGKGGAE